jgi:TonB-dependent receptor
MRNRARVFGCLLVGTSMISITQPTTAAAAVQASQAVRFYDIPAQPLGSALSSYAEVSGVDLVANPAAVKGKRSHAIKGNFSPEDALNEILRGTSLDYRMSSNGSVIVGGTMGYIPASVRAPASEVDGVQLAQNEPQPAPTADKPAQQQSTSGDAEPQIVITGIRASLQRSRDIKRNATGVVDAVSAEEIGKFPDTNLAESLQRIPGVSIERRNGEGARVTVRGFGPQYNLVTVNGRQMATADLNAVGGDQDVDFNRAQSRSFDFSNLASDGVSRLEVYKTGRAAMPSGGIGATINIVTLRPLDGPETGFRGSIGAKAQYDSSLDKFKVTPEVSGILSWSNDADTVGVSLFGAYQKRNSAAGSSTVNDWNILTYQDFLNNVGGMYKAGWTQVSNAPSDPNELVAVPNDSRYHYSTSRRETINGSASVQFKPMETLTITADGLYARNRLSEDRSDQTNWFNRPFDTITFDDDPVVATAIKLGEGGLFDSKDIGFEQQHRSSKTTLYSAGLNAKWELTDQLTVNLDGNTSQSKSRPDSPNGATSTLVSFGAPVVDAHSVDFTGAIPQQSWTLNDCYVGGTGPRGNCNHLLDIGDLGTAVQRTNTTTQSHRVNQFRADLGWNFGGGARFDVGATYIDSKMTSAQRFTQQQLGDWGISHVGDVQQLAGDLVSQFCMACKFDHYSPSDAQIDFRGNAVDLYNVFGPYYASQGNAVSVTGNSFDRVREKVTAAYAQLSWDGEFAGRRVNLVGGLRWENTKVNSFALVSRPTAIVWKSDNDFSTVVGSDDAPINLKGEYSNLLPQIDFKIEPMEHMVARVSYSKTLARPEYQFLFASTLVNSAPNRPIALGGVATGSTGNPDLKPLVSDNVDLSLEYYYGRSNYVSAGFFAKKVKNFVGIAQVDQSLFGLRDPSSGAPGTLSGTALTQLNAIGATISDVTLFTMTALLVKHNNDLAAATSEFQANYSGGQLSQAFVDQILGQYDITASANDPLLSFSVATPINNRNANIHGIEIQGQHFFGNTGFGVAGSLTKVFGDVHFDRGSSPTSNAFAVTGLSDTANATLIFEKFGISARVAYNWRGKFLSRLNRGGNHNPVYYAPFGTLDASVAYNVTPNALITFEAQNLTSEPIRTYARSTHQLYFAQELHPRFWLGARYRFGGNAAPPPPPPAPPAPPPPPATQTCPDGAVIEVTATCPAPPPPPPPPPPPATQGERGN